MSQHHKLLSAYYFRQNMYTLVPRHVRDDMQWMADIGTDAIDIAVLENDLTSAKENIETICREADRAGMKVFAVPTRWGGLFAGAPKVPSIFTANNPETWMCDKEGNVYKSSTWGPMSSVHHPATFEFFCKAMEKLLQFDFAGIIWDEPKPIAGDDAGASETPDYNAAARAVMPADADDAWHIDAFAQFVDRVDEHALSINPNLTFSMFVYGHMPNPVVDRMAKLKTLHYFGPDGKPWSLADLPVDATGEYVKALLDHAPKFIDTCRATGMGTLALIENHNTPLWGNDIMDRRLPEVLKLDVDHLLYYYYPRNIPDPDANMAIIAKHLRTQ